MVSGGGGLGEGVEGAHGVAEADGQRQVQVVGGDGAAHGTQRRRRSGKDARRTKGAQIDERIERRHVHARGGRKQRAVDGLGIDALGADAKVAGRRPAQRLPGAGAQGVDADADAVRRRGRRRAPLAHAPQVDSLLRLAPVFVVHALEPLAAAPQARRAQRTLFLVVVASDACPRLAQPA
ncbi:hypothetical protein HK100_008185, partial [Physocladia obscura]